MPVLAVRCMDSWRRYLPEYEFVEWNEDNFDVSRYRYTRQAYDCKKYAFVSDVVRLWALYNEGGIYMDTDVETVAPLDSLLSYEAVSGFETEDQIPTAVMGACAGSPIIGELLGQYEDMEFTGPDGRQNTTTNVTYITETLMKYGLRLNNELQTVKGMTLLPKHVLCPKSYETGKIEMTEETLAIHHFASSWHGPKERIIAKLGQLFGHRRIRALLEARQRLLTPQK